MTNRDLLRAVALKVRVVHLWSRVTPSQSTTPLSKTLILHSNDYTRQLVLIHYLCKVNSQQNNWIIEQNNTKVVEHPERTLSHLTWCKRLCHSCLSMLSDVIPADSQQGRVPARLLLYLQCRSARAESVHCLKQYFVWSTVQSRIPITPEGCSVSDSTILRLYCLWAWM